MSLNFVLLLCTLLSIICSKITLENGLTETQITPRDLSSFSEVLVQASFSYVDNDRFQKIHLCVRSSDRHKKQAYMDLLKKYNGVVKTLLELKAIPNKQSMIHSVVHRNYHRKSRRWQFFRYFIIYTLKQDLPLIEHRLKKFNPQKVRTDPIIHYLDQKFMSIAAFIEAKLELQKFIREHLNNQYKILLTKDIEIIGQHVSNQNLIQWDIEQQFNEQVQGQREGQGDAREIRGYYGRGGKGAPLKHIEMKVLFQLADKNADIQDLEDEGESQSISDFEDGIWRNQVEEEDEDEEL